MCNQNIKVGQIVQLTKSIIYETIEIEISIKAEVLAVGAQESFLLMDDINTGGKKNLYVENSTLIPLEEQISA